MATPTLIRASQVESKTARWFLPGLIPQGCISIIDGDPGQGKSFLTLEFAAAFSRGQTFTSTGRSSRPTQSPQRVVVMNSEDLREYTLVPRLKWLDADLDQITFVEGPRLKDGDTVPLLFPEAGDLLEQALRTTQAKLLIVDPLMAFLSPHVKSFSDQDVRLALRPLKNLAERFGCTVLLVRHLNKTSSPKLIYRGGGSIGLVGLARAAFYVGPDPDDKSRKLFAQVKSNLGPLQPPWLFSLETHQDGQQKVRWHGESDRPLSRALDTPIEKLPREIAVEMLQEKFKNGGDIAFQALVKAAGSLGVSESTLKRAYFQLGLKARKVGDAWYWYDPKTLNAFEAVSREASSPSPI
jgi:KaiC/GvpD/RAD55 family RecA-like ATPase